MDYYLKYLHDLTVRPARARGWSADFSEQLRRLRLSSQVPQNTNPCPRYLYRIVSTVKAQAKFLGRAPHDDGFAVLDRKVYWTTTSSFVR